MIDAHPYRMPIRQSIIALLPGVTYELEEFDWISDVFRPGMVGNGIHPKGLADLSAFAEGGLLCYEG